MMMTIVVVDICSELYPIAACPGGLFCEWPGSPECPADRGSPDKWRQRKVRVGCQPVKPALGRKGTTGR